MLCGFLTLVQAATTLSTRKYSWSPDDIQWEGTMWAKYENSVLPGILAAVGGAPQLKAEIIYIMNEASSMRNVSTSKTVNLGVEGNSIIAKICFKDGICWVANIYENRPGICNRGVDYGPSAAALVQRYCPDIPINAPRRCGLHKLKYCFTDWVVGETLFDRLGDSMKMKLKTRQTIPIPQKTVTSLAEFVYNLTTCPIPKAESKALFGAELTWIYVVTKMKRDDFRDYVRLPGNLTAPEAMNVTDWVAPILEMVPFDAEELS